jgi:hypothetical protein
MEAVAMKAKHKNAPPEGEAWVWLTLQMMQSDAWRTSSANVNCGRFINFLLVEFMQHRGLNNGKIKAPYQDLEQIGIGLRLICPAIALAESVGLVDCHRGGMRVATTYTLNWLPLPDGTPPNNLWKKYRNPDLNPWPQRRKGNQNERAQ